MSLLGFSRLLRQEYGQRLDETGQHFLDRIEQASHRMEALIKALEPVMPGARVEVEGGFDRPPMERNEQMIATFEQAKAIAANHGLTLRESGIFSDWIRACWAFFNAFSRESSSLAIWLNEEASSPISSLEDAAT